MSRTIAQPALPARRRSLLSQLKPFNPSIFDGIFAQIFHRYRQPMTQYELMKLHVVIDVRHVFETGIPVIGGPMFAWPNGPVVRDAYSHVIDAARYKTNPAMRVIATRGKA